MATISWADDVLLLSGGRIVVKGKPSEFDVEGSYFHQLNKGQATAQILTRTPTDHPVPPNGQARRPA